MEGKQCIFSMVNV